MTFPDLADNRHQGFVMQQFVEYDSSIVLLSHLTPAILLFMFFLNWDMRHLDFQSQDDPQTKK